MSQKTFAVTHLTEKASPECDTQTLPVNHASHKQVTFYTFAWGGWQRGELGWGGAGLSPVL